MNNTSFLRQWFQINSREEMFHLTKHVFQFIDLT